MSETKFTKGPWHINRHSATTVENENGRSIAATAGYSTNMDGGKYVIENQANANLIAAAPDMYVVLERVLRVVSGFNKSGMFENDERTIREILAKARGES